MRWPGGRRSPNRGASLRWVSKASHAEEEVDEDVVAAVMVQRAVRLRWEMHRLFGSELFFAFNGKSGQSGEHISPLSTLRLLLRASLAASSAHTCTQVELHTTGYATWRPGSESGKIRPLLGSSP